MSNVLEPDGKDKEEKVSNVCRKCKRAIDDHNFLTEPKGCPK